MSLNSVSYKSRLARDGLSIVSGQVVTAIGLLLGTRLITEFVPPRIFGEASLMMGLSMLCSNVVCQPILQAALRFYPDAVRIGGLRQLRRTVQGSLGKLAAVFAGGAVAVGFGLRLSHGTSVLPFVALAGLFAVDTLRALETSMLSAARRQGAYASWTALEAWARPASAVGMVCLFGASTPSVLFGFVAASSVVMLLFKALIPNGGIRLDNATGEFDEAILRERIRRFGAPLVPLAIVGWINSVGDRYLIGALIGDQELGIYAAAYGLVSRPFLMAHASAELVFRPHLYEAASRGDGPLARRTFRLLLATVIATCSVGLIASLVLRRPIVSVFLGPRYQQAVIVIPWIAIAYTFVAISYCFQSRLYAKCQTGKILGVRVVTALATLLLVPCFVLKWGIVGAGVACAGCFLLESILFANAGKEPRQKLGIGSVCL